MENVNLYNCRDKEMLEHLKVYNRGESVAIPENFEDGCNYSFRLIAKFGNVRDAEMFAEMKSKNTSASWRLYSVAKNLDAYYFLVDEYCVYDVLVSFLGK